MFYQILYNILLVSVIYFKRNTPILVFWYIPSFCVFLSLNKINIKYFSKWHTHTPPTIAYYYITDVYDFFIIFNNTFTVNTSSTIALIDTTNISPKIFYCFIKDSCMFFIHSLLSLIFFFCRGRCGIFLNRINLFASLNLQCSLPIW